MQTVPNEYLKSLVQGRIKYYNEPKGFGFAKSPQGDVFFHAKGYQDLEGGIDAGRAIIQVRGGIVDLDELVVGRWLAMHVIEGKKGPAAHHWHFVKDIKRAQTERQAIPQYRLVIRYWYSLGIVGDPEQRRFVHKMSLKQRIVAESCDLQILQNDWGRAIEWRTRPEAEFQVQVQVDGEWQKAKHQVGEAVMSTSLFGRRVGEVIKI